MPVLDFAAIQLQLQNNPLVKMQQTESVFLKYTSCPPVEIIA
jgi:hypothetical protein